MTDAEMIDRLIDQAAHAPDWRSGWVRPGHLPLFNSGGPVMYCPGCNSLGWTLTG